MKIQGRMPVGIGIVVFAVFIGWNLHWALTCVGPSGALRLNESRPLVGLQWTWGHTSALMWAEQGQAIHVRYDVNMAERGRLALRVGKWKPAWDAGDYVGWKVVSLSESGAGAFSFPVRETGLHGLHRVPYSRWKGDARVSWIVE